MFNRVLAEVPVPPLEVPPEGGLLGKSDVLTETIEPLGAVTVVVTLPSGLVTTEVVSADELEPELPPEPEAPWLAELFAPDAPEADDVLAVACVFTCGMTRLAAETPEILITHPSQCDREGS